MRRLVKIKRKENINLNTVRIKSSQRNKKDYTLKCILIVKKTKLLYLFRPLQLDHIPCKPPDFSGFDAILNSILTKADSFVTLNLK